ncbi:MAG TPA: SUMF1/EgtB/PvdO family nonheme iron enzyme [Polyangiaceae bacterium]|nr:SUMF1/EgtB/PvdO family nonheme iron enzyme [Polyangiaceae bacterium]
MSDGTGRKRRLTLTAIGVGGLAVMVVAALLQVRRGAPRNADPSPRENPADNKGSPHAAGASQTPAPAPTRKPADPPAPALSAPARPPAEVAFPGLESKDLREQKAALLGLMQRELELDEGSVAKVRTIYEGSSWMSQGNPKVTQHPMTRAECRARRASAEPLPSGDSVCGKPNMVALYDPSRGETVNDARACIDQYEFPNIPCEYPVIWVKADEAVELCKAEGKRICDAHEWEGGCAGALKKPEEEYAFGQRRLMIEYLHNKERDVVWSYGKTKDHSKCATGSRKSTTCNVIDWDLCGSNTYPAGSFPECRSPFGAFDLNGNAAEHMNLPLTPEQLASRGGLGETEMKGSWFIFAMYEAHEDDCRWRAPMWHKSKIDARGSHRNYHLGFRCCSDVKSVSDSAPPAVSAAPPSSVAPVGSAEPTRSPVQPGK